MAYALNKIIIEHFNDRDQTFEKSEFNVNGDDIRVTCNTEGFRKQIVHAEKYVLRDTPDDHGRQRWSIARPELTAGQLTRMKRLLYVCALTQAFIALFRALRQQHNLKTELFPRNISARALRMSCKNLDKRTRMFMGACIQYALQFETKHYEKDIERVLGALAFTAGAGSKKQLKTAVDSDLLHVLEQTPGLLEQCTALNEMPQRRNTVDEYECLVQSIKSLAPALLARRAALAVAQELL